MIKPNVSPSKVTRGKSKKKKTAAPTPPAADQEEAFIRSTTLLTQAQLVEEQNTKLEVMKQLHHNKIASIWSQLHLQLYKIWNDLWLQRQKVYEQAHKEWLKLLNS